MSDWTKDAMDQAKQLAPWRTNLPWWVVLVEGIILGVVGILVLLDPRQTSVNVALFLTVMLLVAGLLQLWSALRDKVPQSVESAVSARGAIAVFSGLLIWLLFFMDLLLPEVGRIIFGLGSLLYGLGGFFVVFGTLGAQRRTALIESIFYTLIGVLMIYVHFAGPTGVVTATRIVGWVALLAGLALIGLAIWRQRQGAAADEKIEQITHQAQQGQGAIADAAQRTEDTAAGAAAATAAAADATAEEAAAAADKAAQAAEKLKGDGDDSASGKKP
jgi:uncharacterized membrane protein HdeD (DUF308 family)